MKRYDGEPLTRSDVQHAVLCHLFSDTRRVFTNPRAGSRGAPMRTFLSSISEPKKDEGSSADSERERDRHVLSRQPRAVQATVASAVSGPFPTCVWPYGQSEGCARRGDETHEEYEAWRARREAYLKWRDDEYPASVVPEGEEIADGSASGAGAWTKPGAEKLTFKELYLEALMNSGKCTKSMREKCIVDEEYAEDFSKVCLLVNVGRINTTLAFYPEMKTVLRSYHPVPSLQKSENTRRNMQDAPRMKSLLKAVLLPYERPGGASSTASAGAQHDADAATEEVPGDLAELARRLRRDRRPPTSVVTLIFLLAQHANEVNALHFAPPHDVHTLFFPQASHPISARQRADAFLWLLYHYLEGPAAYGPMRECPNPFDDAVSRGAWEEAHRAWVEQGRPELSDADPFWHGVPNPAYARWREEHPDVEHDAEAKGRAARSRSRDDVDAAAPDTEEREGAACPESHTHRILVPSLAETSAEAFAREDADPPEEVAWGKQMQGERSSFLLRFQEEEQAKVMAQSGEDGHAAGATSEDTGATDTKPKKRNLPGTQSCYPLANILANAAAAGAHKGALNRSPIGFVKRARLSSRSASTSKEDGSIAHDPDTSHSSADNETLELLDSVEDGEATATDAAPRSKLPALSELNVTVPEGGRARSLFDEGLRRWQAGNADDSDEEDAKATSASLEEEKTRVSRVITALRAVQDMRTKRGAA